MQQVNPVNPVKQCLPVESTGFNKLNTVHGFFQKLGGGGNGQTFRSETYGPRARASLANPDQACNKLTLLTPVDPG